MAHQSGRRRLVFLGALSVGCVIGGLSARPRIAVGQACDKKLCDVDLAKCEPTDAKYNCSTVGGCKSTACSKT